MNPAPIRRVLVGKHVVDFDPPDICVIRPIGDVTERDIHAIFDAFDQFAGGVPKAYQLIDVSEVGHVSPEARKVAGMRQLPPSYAGLVVFGGTFQQQLIAKLITTAGWVLRGRALGKPMPHCTRDEDSARKWIEERRTT